MVNRGHIYAQVSLDGRYGAHLGDVINNYPPSISIEQSRHNELFDRLYTPLAFERMDARLRNIAAAGSHICVCVRETSKFEAWKDRTQSRRHDRTS